MGHDKKRTLRSSTAIGVSGRLDYLELVFPVKEMCFGSKEWTDQKDQCPKLRFVRSGLQYPVDMEKAKAGLEASRDEENEWLVPIKDKNNLESYVFVRGETATRLADALGVKLKSLPSGIKPRGPSQLNPPRSGR